MTKDRYQSTACAFVFVFRGQGAEREVLLHLRQGTGFMDGWYDASASGHLEPGETLEGCVLRETKEEIGLTLRPEGLEFCFLLHNVEENYLKSFFFAELPADQTPKVCEPDKSGGLLWAKLNDLPEHIAPFLVKALECIKMHIYYDDGNFSILSRLSG